ncbi:disease resistance protein SUMM2-like [Pistacia vera]|uniref:disease resistance protein SUMM2-like n=1 Tax=Pistacia vera TaxID=55513 RepID=UPI001262BC67|nr:disease resistance protein SUMM2-like [Pistacia vera]
MGNVVSCSFDPVLSRFLDCTIRRAKHVRDLKDNLQALETDLQQLIQTRNDVTRRVCVDEQNQMKRMDRVQGWLQEVQEAEAEVDELLQLKSQQTDKLCLGGYCSKNCKSSYEYGKQVAKKLKDVAELRREGAAFQQVAERVPDDVADEIPLEPTILGLESTFDKVWKCLVGEEVGIIGIYGTGGVGKTTLLKQINNKFCNELQSFDVVIWVVVSRVPNFEKIQEDIGEKIGLKDESWKKRSLQKKAGDIFKILSSKKFVLLLDDIWSWINLTEVGVPIPNSKSVSKVVFTTRSFEVCGSMKADKNFKVDYLRDEEAWKLFEEKLQSEVLDHPDIPQFAKVVAKECGGLPLALLAVSRAMSCKNTPQEWRHAAKLLRNSASKFAGMGTEVYTLLKFSYDSLPSDKIRSCLLYCCLYPEDFLISKQQLIDCWIGEGFLDDSNRSEVYDEGYYIIGILVHACLLEEEKDKEDEKGDYLVKLHDVIRDMLLWIANDIEKEKENYLVQAGTGLTQAPEIGKWVGVRKISLIGIDMVLSQTPRCHDLQTLFLNKGALSFVCDNFFDFMPSLKVLNLSFSRGLSKLPVGVSKLVSLQYLNLSSTPIIKLPVELKALTDLKCLSLENTTRLRTIPRQLISNLQSLRTLRMRKCGISAKYRTKDNVLFDGGGEVLVEECDCLEYLNVLSITLGSYDALQRLLSSVKLQSCTQSLFLKGFRELTSFNIAALATLRHLCQLEIYEWHGSGMVKVGDVQKIREPSSFSSLHDITLSNCNCLRDLTWIAFIPNLKFLSIHSCDAMKEIINVEKLGEVPGMMSDIIPFQKLQFLLLDCLKNLKSIFGKALPFPHLKEIYVSFCPKLMKLPLDANSAKEHKIVIEGDEEWWKNLQWEDEATRNAFLPCFFLVCNFIYICFKNC